jgi:hypothetical protein
MVSEAAWENPAAFFVSAVLRFSCTSFNVMTG